MNLEFTGERVIPGLVDVSLWNEHLARYRFAARFVLDKRVLDAGCGSGYGSNILAKTADLTIGIDISESALQYSQSNSEDLPQNWTCGTCEALPFRPQSFDAVVAFETIEHLSDQSAFLAEVRSILTTDGLFIVSTPNREYYTESRAQSGPNPFHTREFNRSEFQNLLRTYFEHVEVLVEDHTEGLLIRAEPIGSVSAEVEDHTFRPETVNFFLAICSNAPLPRIESYLFLPRTANLLQERSLHIARLESELAMKDTWLHKAAAEHQVLVEQFRRQTAELESSNDWARTNSEQAEERGQRVVELQDELSSTQAHYQALMTDLEKEFEAHVQWATSNEEHLNRQLTERTDDLQRQTAELFQCVDLLHASESLVRQRTDWALVLDSQRELLEAKLAAVQSSRWLRFGRKLGLGPELQP